VDLTGAQPSRLLCEVSNQNCKRDACAPVPVSRSAIIPNLISAYLKLDRTNPSANHSCMSFASITNEIDKLEPTERAALIDLLWKSLDEDLTKQTETKWALESEDRIDAFEHGELPAVDGPSAIQELRSSLGK